MRPPHPVTWLREHPRAADALLAALTTTIAVIAHLVGDPDLVDDPDVVDPTWWSVPLAMLTAAPVAWRRTNPLASGLVVVGAQVLALLVGVNGASFLGSSIAVYSIGAHTTGTRRTTTMWAIVAMVAALFVAGWIDGQPLLDEFVSTVIVLVAAFVLGDNLRRRRDHLDDLAERAERAERERELLAQQRVNDERNRIARELHDVVAHSVSVMVIQAAAARRNLTTSPDAAAGALSAIEDTGRHTMNELRSILGVLRRHQPDAAGQRRPEGALDDLESLVATDEELPVDLTIEGRLDDLPPGLSLAGYRVVQEALTNVRRHAGLVQRVEVHVARLAHEVQIQVSDDGRGAAADATGPGYGLVGMRERVEAVGGSLDAAPRSGGGWRVEAHLPLTTRQSSAGSTAAPRTVEVSS